MAGSSHVLARQGIDCADTDCARGFAKSCSMDAGEAAGLPARKERELAGWLLCVGPCSHVSF